MIVQVKSKCFSLISLLYSLFVCQHHRKIPHVWLSFFHSPFLSPHRKTLQLNWTGATESPLFPQADFSGNYFSLLPFAGPLRISSRDPVTSPIFYAFSRSQHVTNAMFQGLNVPMCVLTLTLACTHARSHLDAALFSRGGVVLLRVCLRGSCGAFRSGHTSHTGAGLAWWAVGHRGGGLTHC